MNIAFTAAYGAYKNGRSRIFKTFFGELGRLWEAGQFKQISNFPEAAKFKVMIYFI